MILYYYAGVICKYLCMYVYQLPSFKVDRRVPVPLPVPGTAGPEEANWRTEILPVKDSHTRIKPLPLASGHGRYIHNRYTRTGTCVLCPLENGRYIILYNNRYKFLSVSLPKRLRNGRFTSETAVRRFQKQK